LQPRSGERIQPTAQAVGRLSRKQQAPKGRKKTHRATTHLFLTPRVLDRFVNAVAREQRERACPADHGSRVNSPHALVILRGMFSPRRISAFSWGAPNSSLQNASLPSSFLMRVAPPFRRAGGWASTSAAAFDSFPSPFALSRWDGAASSEAAEKCSRRRKSRNTHQIGLKARRGRIC